MRKELFIAVVLGLTVGLIVTYGVYTANQALSKKDTVKVTNVNSLSPSPINDEEPVLTLSVSSPQDGIVVGEPDIKIEGTTLPNAIVTFVTDEAELIAEADENGVFVQQITLIKGANTIEVSATDFNTMSPKKIIQLVYSTEVDTIKQN